MKDFVKYLISVNRELIEKTALGNCHCRGLNSFVINEKPKIRLFIAEENCELFNKFDRMDPVIPIHPHKYDDLFYQLEGTMINHIYEVSDDGIEFKKYRYVRLSDDPNIHIENCGTKRLKYLGGQHDLIKIKSTTLHTASLIGDRCSWLVIETIEDKDFKPFAYHQNLVKRNELYKPIKNPYEYLNSYLNIK